MRQRAALLAATCAVLGAACGGARAPETADGVAPASGAPQTLRSRCGAADTVQAVPAGVYRACEVDQSARPRGRIIPSHWEPSVTGVRDCYVAVVGFVVDEQGIPQAHTAKVIRTNDPRFARAIIDAMSAWRYSPAMRDGLPVAQWMEYRGGVSVVRVVASSPSAAAAKAAMARAPRC